MISRLGAFLLVALTLLAAAAPSAHAGFGFAQVPGTSGLSDAAVGKLNGDARTDFVELTGSSLIPLLRNADGSYTALTAVPTGGYEERIDLADVNGDGRLDAILSGGNQAGTGVRVFLGNSAGSFGAASYTNTGLQGPAVVADVDKDAKPDLVVATQSALATLKGNGAGGFTAVGTAAGPQQFQYPTDLTAGDFDGDGDPDFAATGYSFGSGEQGVHIFRNDGGVLQTSTMVSQRSAYDVTAGDVDGDNKPDLAVTHNTLDSTNFDVLKGAASLAFPALFQTKIDYITKPVFGQLGGTNAVDVATIGYSSNRVEIREGNGAGQFTAPAQSSIGLGGADPTPGAKLRAADIDGDGLDDLAFTASGLYVLTQTTPPVAALSHTPAFAENGQTITLDASGSTEAHGRITGYAFDLDGDGTYETNSTTATITTSFSASGIHRVGVRVTNNAGETSTATDTVETAPKLAADFETPGAPFTPPTNVPVNTTASGGFGPYSYTLSYTKDSSTTPVTRSATARDTLSNLSAGIYHVTVTVKDTKNQTASATHDVRVAPTLNAQLSASDNPTVDQAVQLSASASSGGLGSLRYAFDLDGNGSFETDTGTTATTSKTFAKSGSYLVGVRVTDSTGVYADKTTSVVVASALKAALTHSPAFAQNGATITFDASGTRDAHGTPTFAFDLDGDGSFERETGTTATTTTSYATSGTHQVKVKATNGDGDTSVATDSVETAPALTVDFSDGGDTHVPGSNVTITSTPTGGFGPSLNYGDYTLQITYGRDGDAPTVVNNATRSQTLANLPAGVYHVTVKATDAKGQTASKTRDVRVASELVATLTGKTNPQVGETITLDASGSHGGLGQLRYEFDLDGNGSFETDAGTATTRTTSFATAGTYTLKVRITDASGATAVKTLEVGVGTPLAAALTSRVKNPETGQTVAASGDTVVVEASATGGSGTYHYAFDLDGNGSYEAEKDTTASAETSFADTGDHTVGVRVTDDADHDDTKTTTVTVAPRLSASFSLSPAIVAPDATVNLDARASAGGVGTRRYAYDLDGNGSFEFDAGTNAQPTASYASLGGRDIGLKVTDDRGQSALATPQHVDVADPLTPQLTYQPAKPEPGEQVTLDASASAGGVGVLKYAFDRDGDGSYEADTGTTATTTTTFATAGAKTVGVQVTDGKNQVRTKVITVTIVSTINASFTATPTIAAPGGTIALNAGASSGGTGTLRYAFDLDGNGSYETDNGTSPTRSVSYGDRGDHLIGLKVADDGNHAATTTRHVDVADPLVADLRVDPSSPFANSTVTLDASGSAGGVGTRRYAFDLDGNGTYEVDNGTSPRRSFLTVGAHTHAGVRVTDDRAQTAVATIDFDTPGALTATFTIAPAVLDTATDATLNAGGSSGGITPLTYIWDLDGDGVYTDFATDRKSPVIVAKLKGGAHAVGLRITDARGDSATTTKPVDVPGPVAADLTVPSHPETSSTITVTGAASGGRGAYKYAFQVDNGSFDGASSAPSRNLKLPIGSHSVIVRATDADGRTATAAKPVAVEPDVKPAFSFDPAEPEGDKPITFDASASTGAGCCSYAWDFGPNGKPKTATGKTATAQFPSSQTNTVKLTATDGYGHSRSVEKKVTTLAACEHDISFALTQVKTTGCLVEHRSGSTKYYDTSATVKLNGIPLNPPSGTKLRFTLPTDDAPGGKIGGAADMKFNGDVIYSGDLDFKLPDGGKGDTKDAANLQIPGKGISIKGFKVDGGFALRLGRSKSGDFFSLVKLNVALPDVFKQSPEKGSGGVTGEAAVKVDDGGPNLDGVKIEVKNAWMGKLQVESACFSYVAASASSSGSCSPPNSRGKPYLTCNKQVDAERWDGSAVVVLPTASKPRIGAFGGTSNGDLAYFGGFVENLGHSVPVAEGVYLNNVGIGLCLTPPPFKLKGSVGLTALPAGDQDLVGVNGYFQYTNSDPWVIEVGGDVSILQRQIADGWARFQSTGAVDFHFHAGVQFPSAQFDLASVDGNVDGWLEPAKQTFNVHGDVEACVIKIACTGGEAVFSSTGVGACIDVFKTIFGNLRAGFGYRWKGDDVDLLGNSCDLGPYSAVRTRQLVTDGSVQSITVPAGQKALVLQMHGDSAPPKLVLTGPEGTQVASSPATDGVYDPQKFILAENPIAKTTSVMVPVPAAGQWRIATQPGSAAITGVDQAQVLPRPDVKATVSKSGKRYVLHAEYALAATDEMSFVERGPRNQKTLGTASKKLCSPTATKLCDDFAFKPQHGPAGSRKLLAVISRSGIPVDTIEVGAYVAPPAPKPRRVKHMRLIRTGKSVVVSWAKRRIDGHYQAVVQTGDGAARVQVPKPGCSSVRVKGVRRGTSVRASVFGIRKDLVTGRHAVIRLKGAEGYRSHWPRLRKRLHISPRCA